MFESADPDYFIPHVDVTRIREYREEAAKLPRRSVDRALVSPSQRQSPRHHRADRGPRTRRRQRTRAGLRHALRRAGVSDLRSDRAGVGSSSWRVAAQHLARLMGRGRALEVMLSAEDYDAELAERYGWINRALPPMSSAISSDRSLIGSRGFRPRAMPRSRIASTPLRSRRPTTSAATPICSARASATPRRNARSKPR